ncbi:hypothetical protein Angca_007353 [Angiostrongylus cantonensis]|nr:hypothetical protein Angca_007353 [Angiostrongylus cantonensis]
MLWVGCKTLTFDEELIRRLITEEEFRLDPKLAKLPEQKDIQITPCFDYHKVRDGVVQSTPNHETILESFRSMLSGVERMKMDRPKLDLPEKILMHSCWKCARREGESSSESSVSSSSSESDSSYSDGDSAAESESSRSSSNDDSNESEDDDEDGGECDDSEWSDVEKMNTRQRSSYLLRKEFDRKYRSGAALCDDICFNEPEVGAYGLMCRCSTSARQNGLRHNVFPGENSIPNCAPNENNAAKLYHYVLVVTRPSAPLGEGTRTRISYSGESYVFQGFSVFFHRELPGVLPRMPVSRWTSEYEFHFEKAPMLDCFTVEELNMFHRYLFVDLLELYDESLRAFGVNDGCPIYHVMPRFISERDRGQRMLPMSIVLRYLHDSFKPLVTEQEVGVLSRCSETESIKILTAKKFQLATNPRKRPSTIRVDSVKRLSTNDLLAFGIEHKTSPPVAYANLKNPELVEAQRRLCKLRQVQSNSANSQQQKEQLEDINTLLKRIVELKQQRAVQLSAPKVIPCSGFLATGIYADVPAHVLLLILAVKHARFHWSLAEFEKIISYTFANRSVVELAFTHPSYKNDFGRSHPYSLMYYLLCSIYFASLYSSSCLFQELMWIISKLRLPTACFAGMLRLPTITRKRKDFVT